MASPLHPYASPTLNSNAALSSSDAEGATTEPGTVTILQQHSLPDDYQPRSTSSHIFPHASPSPTSFSDNGRQRVGSNHSAAAIESLVEALGTTHASPPTPVPEEPAAAEAETRSNSTAAVAPLTPAMSRGDPHSASSQGAAAGATQKKKRSLFGKKSAAPPPAAIRRSSSDDVDQEKSAAAARGAGAGAGPAPLKFRHHSFWDPKLAVQRGIFFKGFIPVIIMTTTLIVWGFVAIYWASLYETHPERLTAYVVNGDPNGQVGQTLTQALLASASDANTPTRLGWEERSTVEFPDEAALSYVLTRSEEAWVVVRIMDDATQALETARTNGDTSWNPASVVRIVYSQARNYQAAGSYVLPPTQQILQQSMARLNAQLTSQWLQTIAAGGSAATSAIQAAQRAPVTISGPVAYSVENLRPFQIVTIATTFVGLIYVLILAFNVTMAGFGTRQPIQPWLKLRHLTALRLIAPMIAYLFLSLSFATLNLPFGVTYSLFSGNTAQGFFAFWAAMFLGMCVLGFTTEAILSMVGQKFIGFGLVFLIIVNVSGANYPLESLNRFFLYSYAMPFYNLKQAFVAIIYDQGQHIWVLKYFGILLCWLAVLVATLPIWFWYEQRGVINERKAAINRGAAPPATAAPHGEGEQEDADREASQDEEQEMLDDPSRKPSSIAPRPTDAHGRPFSDATQATTTTTEEGTSELEPRQQRNLGSRTPTPSFGQTN